MKAVPLTLALLAAALGTTACISITAPVRERIVSNDWIPGHWAENDHGRVWIEGHYAPVRPPEARGDRP